MELNSVYAVRREVSHPGVSGKSQNADLCRLRRLIDIFRSDPVLRLQRRECGFFKKIPACQ